MNSFAKTSRLAFIAIFLFTACCISFANGGVRNAKSQHTKQVKHTLQKVAKKQIHKYKPQGSKTSSKKMTHNAKIVFNKQVKNSSGIYFMDDMESGINGWTIDTHYDTLWHLTANDYVSPANSWWCGIDGTGTYNTGSRIDQSLISPAIDLTGATLPIHLLFNEAFGTEWGKDFCMVGVSTDGGATWTELRTDTSACSGNSGGWVITDINLSSYVNQIINIRFHFVTSDELNNDYPGWHIDNVIVSTSGTISGVVYFDFNQNGIRDTLDPPWNDWGITASSNLFSFYTGTDNLGMYSFTLPAGTYTITENLGEGWTPTSPSSGSWQITLDPTQSANDTVNFGNWHQWVTVSGYVFSDTNYNGIQDNSETLVPNQVIGIDGPDGFEQYQRTNSSGYFSFVVTDTGKYYIWEELDDPNIQTFPPNWGANEISLHDLSASITDVKFGNYYPPPWGKTCAIGGLLFNDLNKNGLRDVDEPGIGGVEVDLWGDDDRTVFSDSMGYYMFDSLYPGYYEVAPTSYFWLISSPPSQYYGFDLLGGMKVDTANFGVYYSNRTASVGGWIFFDKNMDEFKDGDEPGIAGVEVDLWGDRDRITFSDSMGHFMFDSLYPGWYEMQVGKLDGWEYTSRDDGYYEFKLGEGDGETINCGEYIEASASVSGRCYNVANGQGIGIWTITIEGRDFEDNYFQRQVTTDNSGNYSIDSIRRGIYFVREALRSRWVQTVPPDFKPIVVNLHNGEHLGGINFGNTYDTTFNVGYRSFTSDSIALAKSYDGKKYGQPIKKFLVSQAFFVTGLKNTISSKYTTIVTGLQITFKYAFLDSLVVFPPAIQTYDIARKSVVLSFPDGLSYGDTVQIQGICTNPKPASSLKQGISHPYWTFSGISKSAKATYMISIPYQYMKPNAVDMLMAVMAGRTIQIGIPRDRYSSHTVLMKRYTDVVKSLVDSRGNMHNGLPTCLGAFTSGLSITKQQTQLPPSKQNNMLFAEATALKVNLLASKYNVTAFGFGDLIFDEGGENPLNGNSIYMIADVVDQYMSSVDGLCQMPPGYESIDAQTLYQTIRKIDSAFCGHIDYLSWKPGTSDLNLTAVRPVTEIPYLHIDSSFSTTARHQSNENVVVYAPEKFSLQQNYPNPFNPTTIISFALLQESFVTLKVYNILGQEVATLLNREQLTEGPQEIEFNASSLPSGVYFYQIKADGIADPDNDIVGQTYVAVKKMVLLK